MPRTTLDLELDVLQAAREIGAARGMSAGQVASELATFDRTIPVKAVRGGTAELLHVIEP